MPLNMSEVKVKKFDHESDLIKTDSETLLLELLFLCSGVADEKDLRKGVSLGLSPKLEQRKQAIHDEILYRLTEKCLRSSIL